MSAGFEKRYRSLIPRWLDLKASLRLNLMEVGKAAVGFSGEGDEFKTYRERWLKEKNAVSAAELVSLATVMNVHEQSVFDASKLLVKRGSGSIDLNLYRMACAFLGREEEPPAEVLSGERLIGFNIEKIRSRLKKNEKNPLLWCDLAYWYGVSGQQKKSQKAALVAFGLGRESVYIARSSSRAMLHHGNPQIAVDMLRGNSRIGTNPFLVSADVSICETFGLKHKNKDNLMRIASRGPGRRPGFNEAAMMAATLETKWGKKKKANKLIDFSLLTPDENCLAQAIWLSEKEGTRSPSEYNVDCSYEADTRRFLIKNSYDDALSSCLKWQDFQPFSRHPAVIGSYIAAVAVMDYQKAEEMAYRGYKFANDDSMLVNNYAVSLALNGKLSEASKVFREIKLDDVDKNNRPTFYATAGLIYFESGDAENGRLWYSKAVTDLKKSEQWPALAVALTFWAEQELKYSLESAQEKIAESIKYSKRANFRDLDLRYKEFVSRIQGKDFKGSPS